MDVHTIYRVQFRLALDENEEPRGVGLAGARRRAERRNVARKAAARRTQSIVGVEAWRDFRNATAPRAKVRANMRRAKNRS